MRARLFASPRPRARATLYAGQLETPTVARLAHAHDGIEGLERLVHGRERVVAVQLVEIDVVRPQALE